MKLFDKFRSVLVKQGLVRECDYFYLLEFAESLNKQMNKSLTIVEKLTAEVKALRNQVSDDEDKDVYTSKEAAKYCGLSYAAFMSWTNEHDIKGVRIGCSYFWTTDLCNRILKIRHSNSGGK